MTPNKNALPDERLPFATKLIYGLGDWGNTTTSTIFLFFFSFFLTDIARLDPVYAAPVLLVGGIWDAINDPLVGILADRVQSRWGRRRPFFLFGALPLAIFFVFLWWVPPFTSQIGKAIYYMVAYLLFDTAYTAVNVPYSALTPELTEDYDERTHLSGFRMSVSMAGGLIAAVAVPLLAGAFPERKTGYLLMALIFGILAAVPYLMLFFRVKERHIHVEKEQMGLIESIRHTFRNRPFRYAVGIYMFTWMTVNLIASMMQYFLTYWMRMADQLEIVLGVVQAAALVFIPVMVWLSGRIGKQRAFIAGVSSLMVVMMGLAILPPEMQTLAYVLGVCTGFGIAAAHVIPWSIVPDVIEQDELETGQRREGTFYGFMVFLQKSGTAFTLAIVQWILHLTGYVPDAVQTPAVLTAIRGLFGFLPALLLIPAMILAWRFPIDRSQHEELRRALAAKRAAEKS
jgi:glycoside/pentoside/hexuronide:cation symporter, GPH family